jgi:mono/diheme cytochrome c family protein
MPALWLVVLGAALTILGPERGQPPIRAAKVTYYRDVAAILHRHCVSCHRPGEVGPFALTSYAAASSWSETIREVLEEGRMPPWHANPAYGDFANDPRMTANEKDRVLAWIGAGCPEGDPRDLPELLPYPEGWRIPRPDLVLAMPAAFTVPATGQIDYQYFEVDPGFREDKWIQAAEVRPGNRAVVHHCLIYLRPPGRTDLVEQGPLGSVWLTGVVAGSPPLQLPDGMAKRIPAGWRLVFQMHYTPTGSSQTDLTRLGLVFADPKSVKREVATNMALNFDLRIPAGAANHRVEASATVPADVLLLALSPHMHLRGKSFRYEALYPNGSREILLEVPHYDYNWQNTYQLADPKRLPRGTTIHCVAHFDNSRANPANPDPDAEVVWGTQSWEEMMIGYYDIAPADPELGRTPGAALQRLSQPALALVLLVVGLGFVAIRRLRSRRPAPPSADFLCNRKGTSCAAP